MYIKYKPIFLTFIFFVFSSLFSQAFAWPFNSLLTPEEKNTLDSGQILIRNINYQKYMCMNKDISELGNTLFDEIKELNPKYLAEVIQIKPVQGNEDLPQRLEAVLNNVEAYAGIPYFSERCQDYFNLYDSAKINSAAADEQNPELTHLKVQIEMEPFGTIFEDIDVTQKNDEYLYVSINTNKLRYYDSFDCVYARKMKMCIWLFKDGDNWILYGIGGVNAPRIPLFTERIQTSFINRIKTFCNAIFEKI